MATPRLRLGQLLVDARMITAAALDEVLALQRTDGRRLGTMLVERGLINETQLTQILSHQLSVPWVSLLHIEFSRQLLNLVPRDVADKFCLVPIYVRHVRNQGDTLYVAMDDPSNEDGLQACREHAGLPVRAMIAPPTDIRGAIRVYYGVTRPSLAPEATPKSPVSSTDNRGAPTKREGDPAAIGTIVDPSVIDAAPKPPVSTQPVVAPAKVVLPPDARSTLASRGASPPEVATPVSTVREGKGPDALAIEPHAPPPAVAVALATTPSLEAAEPQLPPVEAVSPDPAANAGPPTTPPEPPSTKPERPGEAPQIEAVEIDRGAALADVDDSGAGASSVIPEPRGRAPRMVALTLLDGTTIRLPAKRRRSSNALRAVDASGPAENPDAARPANAEPAGEDPLNGLTARDLVLALRVVGNGADASEVLGENVRWEALFSALLSLLLKKHLIADWEFVDELKSQR